MLETNREGWDCGQNIWLNIFLAVRSSIVVWWQHPIVVSNYSAPPPGMYCVSADGGRWILFREGSSGREGRPLRALEPLLRERARVRGRSGWPTRSMPGEEGGTAGATRTGTTHNARHFTYCAHGSTQRHTQRAVHRFGGGSVAAAVHQLAAYMSDQTRRQLTNIGKDKHILAE